MAIRVQKKHYRESLVENNSKAAYSTFKRQKTLIHQPPSRNATVIAI